MLVGGAAWLVGDAPCAGEAAPPWLGGGDCCAGELVPAGLKALLPWTGLGDVPPTGLGDAPPAGLA